MRRTVLAIATMLLVLPASASNPGEPLDCSDWVFNEPGLSCQMIALPIWPGCSDIWCLQPSQDTKAVDVDGRLLAVRIIPAHHWITCGSCNKPVGPTALIPPCLGFAYRVSTL